MLSALPCCVEGRGDETRLRTVGTEQIDNKELQEKIRGAVCGRLTLQGDGETRVRRKEETETSQE